MTTYWIRAEYNTTRGGRQRLTLWSGPFADNYEGSAVELPNGDGYMIRLYGDPIRIACPAPRTEDNYAAVDAAINAGLTP